MEIPWPSLSLVRPELSKASKWGLLLEARGTETTLLLNPSRPDKPRGDASTSEVTIYDSSLERHFPLAYDQQRGKHGPVDHIGNFQQEKPPCLVKQSFS